MRRSSAVAGVVALFLVGVAVGALGANVVARHRLRGGPFGHGPGSHMIAGELDRRLHLTADQRRQLDAILADSHRETMALWREVRPRIAAVVERAQDRIAQILIPEQRREFERFRGEHHEHLRLLFHH
jgi:Spy/CpxP family protein refolding chaperone